MIELQKIFSKYTGYLRSLKLVYVINNLLNWRKLRHNRVYYRKYGLEKTIFGSVGADDFPKEQPETPWLDQDNSLQRLKAHPHFSSFSSDIQQQLVQFVEDGYMILRGFYSSEEVESLNKEVDDLLQSGKQDFNFTQRKVMNAYQNSALIDQKYFRNPKLLEIFEFIMGKKIVPFQTINFIEGSEQRAHSDSIHMTTYPEGYLIAAWTALEPTSLDNGALFYYPKSHRLPYVTCLDYNAGNTRWRLGQNSYKKYEEKIDQIIGEGQLEIQHFMAQPGDVLIWHANLLHGGSPILQAGRTRRSMVAHYFCEDVICYHELSQRPAMLDLTAG